MILSSLLSTAASPIQAANADAATIKNSGIDLSNRAFLSFSQKAVKATGSEFRESGSLAEPYYLVDLAQRLVGQILKRLPIRAHRVDAIQTSTSKLATGDVLTVTQSCRKRMITPYRKCYRSRGTGPHPVLIALHGSGGNSNYANSYSYLNQMIRIGPQGYLNKWNIKNETTSAPDVDFIRDLILQLRSYDNVDAGRIILLGSSNGAALINRLLIELNGALFQEAITLAGQMNTDQFHDGVFWYDSSGGNAYDTVAEPAPGRRILAAGTDDERPLPRRRSGWLQLSSRR